MGIPQRKCAGFIFICAFKVNKKVDMVSINVYYNRMFNRMEGW
ncbi:hypothetical protein XBFFR1_500005 [Xenorhabdus bovienii str. feltiae France]|nr:hypothetical protein XBFFR1_500005 [Xenorhabdus bovienii str. feltiae France]